MPIRARSFVRRGRKRVRWMNKIREKLVELVNDVLQYLPWGEIQKDTAERIADRMMDNGVTIANHDDTNGKLLIHFKPDKTLAELKQDLQNAPVMFAGNDGSIEIIKPYGWTSVKDGLPKVGERILVYCESKTIKKHVTACTYMGGRYGSPQFSRHVRKVSHWMPLPEPPKEECL